MKKVNRTQLEDVAKLSRIQLDSKNIDSITEDFESILNFVETIQETKTDNIVTTSQVTGLTDVWREDEVVKSEVEPKVLIDAAPESVDGLIKVKKVL